MAKDFGSQNTARGQGMLTEQTGKGLLQSRKCLICHKVYDLVFEKSGYVYYRHQSMKREHEFSCKGVRRCITKKSISN
jgi:hypothetical protein